MLCPRCHCFNRRAFSIFFCLLPTVRHNSHQSAIATESFLSHEDSEWTIHLRLFETLILLLSAPFFEHAMAKKNLPRHIGFIPDGNRRWAQDKGFPKEAGYAFGIEPGLKLFQACKALGIEEVSIYGFTRDNAKRPRPQLNAFRTACVEFAQKIASEGVALLVLGDDTTAVFPEALKPFRYRSGKGMKVNFLVNYGWDWDLEGLKEDQLRSHEISPIDLIVRWGGGRRLSGFLPVQSVYADLFVIEDYWPDYQPIQFEQALMWFREQDQTLGG